MWRTNHCTRHQWRRQRQPAAAPRSYHRRDVDQDRSRRDALGGRSPSQDDRAFLQITMITAWFNYINRMADALGVGRG
jgi:hypothetical protein